MTKLIARIKGGLGNQLFCYAAARRLALVNDAELVIDDITGFVRDQLYRRCYMLDRFNILARKTTKAERLEPFERYRRGLAKWRARRHPFERRRYIEQEGHDFDTRLLTVKVKGTLYLDGLWQSEGYFRDVEETIRKDLRIVPPSDKATRHWAEEIQANLAVAIHVRWFDKAGEAEINNASADYYRRAVAMMERRLSSPRYFIFSDNPEAAHAKLALPNGRATFVSHNRWEENAYADLWLMTHCQHFIIANSTFSWWGAWLGGGEEKMVICPNMQINDHTRITLWNFTGQIPDNWQKI